MAINKPNNYENTKVQGEFTPVELGGHHLVIKDVREQKSKAGNDMIVVSFDFASKDKQAGYFQESFDNDIRADKKWPHQATKYIMTEDKNKDCSSALKTFITCAENSNAGFEVQWGDNFCSCFKGKELGCVFGEVENEYEGNRSMRRELRWFVSSDSVDSADIPSAKHLSSDSQPANSIGSGFVNIAEGIEEELPFN